MPGRACSCSKWRRGRSAAGTAGTRGTCAVMHEEPAGVLTGSYPLLGVLGRPDAGDGRTDERSARAADARRIGDGAASGWKRHGVRFQPALSGTLHLVAHQRVLPRWRQSAPERLLPRRGAPWEFDIEYDAEVRDARSPGRPVPVGHRPSRGRRPRRFAPSALVAASGGFQGNLEWLKEVWGDAADNFIIRGTPYDTGHGPPRSRGRRSRDGGGPGAVPRGGGRRALASLRRRHRHASRLRLARDRRQSRRRPFLRRGRGLLAEALRDLGKADCPAARSDRLRASSTPARWARSCPRSTRRFEADSLRELAGQHRRRPWARSSAPSPSSTLRCGQGTFDHSGAGRLPNRRTSPLRRVTGRVRSTRPPFFAYPLRPGITFTYLGVCGEREGPGRSWSDGEPSENVFAAGEIMAGNVLGKGYLAGIGMTIGTVFGRIAGEEAARQCPRLTLFRCRF